MFQQMMGQIREESVGFLFNLEVEVNRAPGEVDAPIVAARGLAPAENADEKLSYTAPSDSGGVEVRNQRGQVQRAATDRARRVAAANAAAGAAEAEAESGGDAAPAARGAFGQRTIGADTAPANRAERRSQGKKK
jgi:preprotein translocase subunit SecA